MRLVLIGMASSRQAAHFRRRQGIQLTVLADEERASYRAAGAQMANLGQLLGPRVIAKGISTLARTGQMQGRTVGHPAQLGGAMVIAPGGRIVWQQMARDAGDNADPGEILRAAGTVPQPDPRI